jgi:uncharacterized membrane protein HdeD (DUF308 family)
VRSCTRINGHRCRHDAAGPFRELSRLWWLWLVAGFFSILVALVVLQFDQASIRTVGVLIGLMFLIAGTQNLVIAAFARGGTRWLLAFFGVLLLIAGGDLARPAREHVRRRR